MIELIPESQARLSFERYQPAPEIEGVWVQPLRKHRSSNGWFMELAREGRLPWDHFGPELWDDNRG